VKVAVAYYRKEEEFKKSRFGDGYREPACCHHIDNYNNQSDYTMDLL
jgi:hypothetical protein